MKASTLFRVLAVLAVLVVVAAPAMAQTQAPLNAQEQVNVAKQTNMRTGPGVGIGLSVIGVGVGLGLIGYATLSGVARQPEQVGTLQGLMILLAALVEGTGIIGILFSLAMLFL